MMFEKDLLKSKRVLTTGGGTGLGRSIGDRYLALGADLVSAGCANPSSRRQLTGSRANGALRQRCPVTLITWRDRTLTPVARLFIANARAVAKPPAEL